MCGVSVSPKCRRYESCDLLLLIGQKVFNFRPPYGFYSDSTFTAAGFSLQDVRGVLTCCYATTVSPRLAKDCIKKVMYKAHFHFSFSIRPAKRAPSEDFRAGWPKKLPNQTVRKRIRHHFKDLLYTTQLTFLLFLVTFRIWHFTDCRMVWFCRSVVPSPASLSSNCWDKYKNAKTSW